MTLTGFSGGKYSPLGVLCVECRCTDRKYESCRMAGSFVDPGLGPTKSRKLVEHFGSAEAVLRASLTELEATGIRAVSAQALVTGKSAELAREEIARTAAAGVTVLSMDDPLYPPRLKEIYDPPARAVCTR
jgi:predicted Rossmann fold nucleotide-binding protein DprA/Smf involved in DNA uptake